MFNLYSSVNSKALISVIHYSVLKLKLIITVFLTKNIIIYNFQLTLTSPKALYNKLEESFAILWTTVRHLHSSVKCFPHMANIMINHSYSIVEFAWKYFCLFVQKLSLTYFTNGLYYSFV